MFFGLHRQEVLVKPQYARLQIGKIIGQEETIKPPAPGELSQVPYAEPTWLSKGYYSPYYSEGHRKFQVAARKFFMEVVQPESARCEENGKRISQEVVDKMRQVPSNFAQMHNVYIYCPAKQMSLPCGLDLGNTCEVVLC